MTSDVPPKGEHGGEEKHERKHFKFDPSHPEALLGARVSVSWTNGWHEGIVKEVDVYGRVLVQYVAF